MKKILIIAFLALFFGSPSFADSHDQGVPEEFSISESLTLAIKNLKAEFRTLRATIREQSTDMTRDERIAVRENYQGDFESLKEQREVLHQLVVAEFEAAGLEPPTRRGKNKNGKKCRASDELNK